MVLQVARHGGVSYLLSPEPESPMERGWQVSDQAAVRDALEALLGIAASSEEGRRVCLESGAVAAASCHLQVRGCPYAWLAEHELSRHAGLQPACSRVVQRR